MNQELIRQLLAVLASLVLALQGLNAKLDAQNPKCLLQWNKAHTKLDCFTLKEGKNSRVLFGSITTTSGFNFPTSTYSFNDGDVINAGDFNALLNWMGTRTSTDTTSLSYNAFNPNIASSTGSLTALSSTTGQIPVNKGGTGNTSSTANDLIVGNGTSPFTLIAPSSTFSSLLGSNGSAFTQFNIVTSTGITLSTTSNSLTIGSNLANPLVELATTTLSTATPVISIAGLPQRNYLQIVLNIAGEADAVNAVSSTFNSSVVANYNYRRYYNTAGVTSTATSTTGITFLSSTGAQQIVMDIDNANGANKIGRAAHDIDNGAGTSPDEILNAISWATTTAITSVTFTKGGSANFSTSTSLIIYGSGF